MLILWSAFISFSKGQGDARADGLSLDRQTICPGSRGICFRLHAGKFNLIRARKHFELRILHDVWSPFEMETTTVSMRHQSQCRCTGQMKWERFQSWIISHTLSKWLAHRKADFFLLKKKLQIEQIWRSKVRQTPRIYLSFKDILSIEIPRRKGNEN